MSNESFQRRIDQLSPERRELLDLLLGEVKLRPDWLRQSYVAPRDELERELCAIFAESLCIREIGITDHFLELGGDSIVAIQIVAKAAHLGIKFTSSQLFETPTVEGLAEFVRRAPSQHDAPPAFEPLDDHIPLTPTQQGLLELGLPRPEHWNQTLLLTCRRRLEPSLLRTALAELLDRHEALCMRYSRSEKGWRQTRGSVDDPLPFSHFDLSGLEAVDQQARMTAEALRLQQSLNLEHGPMVRLALFDFGTRHPSQLLLTAHHLVVDGISLRILVEDIQSAYEQLARGKVPKLPRKTTSFERWANSLERLAQHVDDTEVTLWQSMAKGGPPLRGDFPHGRNDERSAREVNVAFDRSDTKLLLTRAPIVTGASVEEILLACKVHAFAAWSGSTSVYIDVERHGRDIQALDIDISRTVGWFALIFPLRLDFEPGDGIVETLRTVTSRLRAVPRRGVGFGLFRYLCRDSEIHDLFRQMPVPQWNFDYLGQFDQALPEDSLFEARLPDRLKSADPDAPRSHLINAIGYVLDGTLKCSWVYSESCFRRQTIEDLVDRFATTLRQLLAAAADVGRVPADTMNMLAGSHLDVRASPSTK